MKKSLFTFLVVFSVFMIAGCSDSDDGDGITTPTMSNLSSLQGTYDIKLFYTSALNQVITNDCKQVEELNLKDDSGNQIKCGTNNSDSDFNGKGTISYKDGKFDIITKVQITGGTYDYFEQQGLVDTVKPNQYNYTIYTPIPESTIKNNIINDADSSDVVKGVTGRNATGLKPDGALNNTYYFEVDGKTITNYMIDKSSGIVEAPVVVKMVKVNDSVESLSENTPFDQPDISDIFVDIPQQ